jgi:hypothetical protein
VERGEKAVIECRQNLFGHPLKAMPYRGQGKTVRSHLVRERYDLPRRKMASTPTVFDNDAAEGYTVRVLMIRVR